ncbi:energy-coupling factor transporter transmembrane component T family protein [Oceanospirillum beijerinckii]|uniref:energy-coupling factor transporter transmembrane component T family protein n=1 Tax=Oceanospirillum beijerinckii TaxID=64976 RepID=UPI00040C54CB|nr:energy-coupling factor transporter transmembrane protein EcfT [Oceanospirillum beijerinckii]MAC45379.1 energy-coupling factor transporter transmembrane protein EcfT [Oceanospirillum sp.]
MISLTSPVETRAHRWPAGLKLSLLCFLTGMLFFIDHLVFHSLFLLAIVVLYALPGREFFSSGWRHLKILWPFILIVALWHLWTGEVEQGAVIVLRMMSAVALANLVTMTTRLSDMIDVVHFLAQPLYRLGLNGRALELAIALVIRMTPVLISKGQKLTWAWRARSNRRSGWRIILPFTVLALDDADHVAEALRARGGLTHLENE